MRRRRVTDSPLHTMWKGDKFSFKEEVSSEEQFSSKEEASYEISS